MRTELDGIEEGGVGNEQIAKALELLAELSVRNLSEEEIGRMIERSRATVFRYIKAINRAIGGLGGKIVSEGGRFRLKREANALPFFTDGIDEAGMAAIASTPLGSLLKKGDGISRMVDRIRPIVDVSRGSGFDRELRSIFEAMLNGGWLSVRYASSEGPKDHSIVPVRLFLDPVQVYLVAWDEERGHLICMATSKFLDIKALKRPRMASGQFQDLGDYVRKAWGKMVRHDVGLVAQASFTALPAVAGYFERNKLSGHQTMSRNEDGTVSFSLPIHNPLEFVRFILRFGKNVRVTGDEEVLAEMCRYLADMREFYPD